MQRLSRRLATLPIILGLLALAACDDDDGELTVSVSATILEPANPVSVETTEVRDADDQRLAHGVRVTWLGDKPASLDDARFPHVVEGSDGGHLVVAGRGCGVDWDSAAADVMHVCTADYQLIWLQPGETHEYPITIFPGIGPLDLERGLYVVDEVVEWSHSNEPAPPDGTGGQFTIRLTYTVD